MDGIINFYKPEGMTSHDVVYYFRKLLNIKRIGHSGTLDPNVAGVLPICIGKGTRVAEYLLEADKEYIGKLSLGYSTDTQDKYGKMVNQSSVNVSREQIEQSFNRFVGNIKQVPPMYSALKIKGKRLYELAREGKTVKREPRSVKIHELDIIKNNSNKIINFYIKCSKGTYIRTLCNDIAIDLGVHGHMFRLIRTGVGNFNIKDSVDMDYLNSISKEQIGQVLMSVDSALKDFKIIIIGENYYKKIINGVIIPINEELDIDQLYRVYCKNKFIGIGEIIFNDNIKYLKMKKVFI